MIPASQSSLSSAAIDWYSFLERPRLMPPDEASLKHLRDASILVTGAGGSIGSALSLRLASLKPRQLTLLDLSEQALYRLQSALAETVPLTHPQFILGNTQDASHLDEIFEINRPQLVFHAAAHKHVPLLEDHPLEALANNALGTLRLAECASSFHAHIVLLSTDKAVAPISILGASKRIAEQIVLAHGETVLRLGNVLGTEGSVSETFLHQIAVSSPVTVTDPGAERYFLTCEEAVDLLLASSAARPGSLLVPNLDRQYSIASLAAFLQSASSPNVPLSVAYAGLRPGDKTSEALWSNDEQPRSEGALGHLEIEHRPLDHALLRRTLRTLEDAVRERDLPRAIETVLELVPWYTPSTTVLALLQRATLRTVSRAVQR